MATLASFPAAAGTLQVLYSFSATDGLGYPTRAPLLAVGNTLYGTTVGDGSGAGVFSIDTRGEEHNPRAFGQHDDCTEPVGHLVFFRAPVYGVCGMNSIEIEGTIYSISTTGDYKIVST